MANYTRSPVLIPRIPPTPGPQTIDNIQQDGKDRFAGIVWIRKDTDRQVDDYFADYDHWEPYSETKSYSKRPFYAAYKGMMKEYHNYLCILNSDTGDEYYVTAKKMRNELEVLEPFCPCIKCSTSRCNPIKYIWCDHCTHCIKAGPGFTKEEYIHIAKLAKENKEKNTDNKHRYIKFLETIPWITVSEGAMMAITVIISVWWLL